MTISGGTVLAMLGQFGGQARDQCLAMLLAPGSTLSLAALTMTLGVAAVMAMPRGRLVRPRVLRRALFPRRLIRSRSGRADIGYTLFGLLLAGITFGWALFSADTVAHVASAGLTEWFGPLRRAPIPAPLLAGATTLAVFIAYEFAYWFDHWLSHKVPLLWHFHKVHHSAESLSLLTNFRVHPIDTILFMNLVALFTGTTLALIRFLAGVPVEPIGIGGTNILVMLFAVGLTHLQHSHLWVTFGPRWGRVLLGPAHHQIHHSSDPAHYDRNFGSSLAIWDRLFGTFTMPSPRREPIRFGVPDLGYDPHGLRAAVVMPFVDAIGCVRLPPALSPRPAR